MTKEVKYKQALEWLIEEVEACTRVSSDDRHLRCIYVEDTELDALNDALNNAIGVLKRRQVSRK